MSADGSRYRVVELLTALLSTVAAAVVQSVAVWPANAQSTEVLFDYPQTFLNGIGTAQVSVPMESCRNLCSTRSGCAGFSYSSAASLCSLFSSVDGASENRLYTAGTRSLIIGYHPPTNPPAAAAQPPKVNGLNVPVPKLHENAKSTRKKGVRKSKPAAAHRVVPQQQEPVKKQGGRFKMCKTVRGVFQVPAGEFCSPGM
ncbi:PAN domain-containing protein [Mesorhizobium sp. M0894]|uniref:PAN domain-containing protein n=1 Tax=unclassified Mesorhizobium TaxID=325217 RepID=UPI0033396639